MTLDESIKQAIHSLDLINKPYALYCNPSDAEQIKSMIPDNIKLVPLSHVESGKTFFVDRKRIEMAYLNYESQAESEDKE